MKILQKILMIVVGVVVAGNVNVEGMLAPPTVTVLDLPVETPGRQMISTPDHKKVFHPNLFFMRNESGQVIHYCEHIIVPNTPASIAFSERGVNAAIKSEGNIYFPADGSQPTTGEAAEYSCANVDDPRIKEWYVEIFKSIIKFQTSGPYEVSEEKQEVFWNMFREIASDPVGRILLYRLLIEIYRVDIRGAGCTEKPYQMDTNRNRLRTITVKYVPYVWYFNYRDSTLSFNDEPYSEYATKVCFVSAEDRRLRTRWGTTPKCVYLFHEMLHWFHKLHDYKRNKSAKFGDTCKLLGFYFKGDCYYDPTEFPQIWSGESFGVFSHPRQTIDLEEALTILGVGDKDGFDALKSTIPHDTYENGDELSENLFSCSLTEHSGGKTRAAMRFGHALLPVGTQYDLIIKKAHQDTVETMKTITGKDVKYWNLLPGQALLGADEIIDPNVVVDFVINMVASQSEANPAQASFLKAFLDSVTAYLQEEKMR